MSTRSLIGRAGKVEGEFTARYSHWDGFPTAKGPELFELIRKRFKGDAKAAIAFLVDKHPAGWSSLAECPCYCHPQLSKRPEFKNRKPERPQLFTNKDVENSDAEWLYIFDEEHDRLAIRDVRHGAEFLVGLDERVKKARWTEIECGGEPENWARCTHYGWTHKLLPRTSNLSTKTYLGLQPLDFHDVIAFEVGGVRYEATGSGGNSDYLRNTTGQRYPRGTWVSSVKRGSVRLDLPVAKIVGSEYAPIPGVVWVMPATKITNQETRVTA
jgi:hypothetical protein